jgi:entericidin A
MNNMKKIVIFSLFLTATTLLVGCGTVKGFGQDVTHAGRDIQKAAS